MSEIEEFADLVDETLHDARNIASKTELEMQVSKTYIYSFSLFCYLLIALLLCRSKWP